MKKLAILAALTLMGTAATSFAQQATVTLNNYDSNIPIMFMGSSGTAAAATGANNVFVQLLGGPSASQLQPVTIAGQTGSVIAVGGGSDVAGFFDAGFGVVPGVAANATATFVLTAFVGNDPSAATAQLVQTAAWTQATGSWAGVPSPPSGPALAIPAGTSLTVGGAPIPEPSTIALGLLGLGALLIRRRK